MKWFKVNLFNNKEGESYQSSIKDIIKEEFGISLSETIRNGENYQFAITDNGNTGYTYLEEENLLIVGDIRIHNLEELKHKYNLDYSFYTLTSNELLMSQLYKHKGIEFIKDVLGEFCFILCDKSNNKKYFIRDQTGSKTLFWCKTSYGFVIASDIFLLRKEMDFSRINNLYFKEFFESNGIVDTESTPFLNINRVPSGVYIETTQESIVSHKYWELADITGVIKYKDENSYVEEFRDLLLKSVKSRLAEGNVNSVMLSGGMDSTSIYALSKLIEQNNSTYLTKSVSAIYKELHECDESTYIRGLLKKYNDEGIFINCDDLLLFDDFPNKIPFSYEPNVNAFSFNFTFSTVKKSVEHGLYNILSGYGGDQLLTGSMYLTRDLLNQFKIKEMLCYITDYSIMTNTSAVKNLIEYTIFPSVINGFDINEESEYYRSMSRKLEGIKYYNQKELYYQISNAKSHIYTDRIIGALAGADISHPFLDRRLIEYVYKIPGKLLLSRDRGKDILRKSMDGYLTREIIQRVNKTAHVTHTYKSLRENWGEVYNCLHNPTIISEIGLITVEDWRKELLKWRNGVQVQDKFWTLCAIELWSNKYNQKLNERLV
ncbi:Asparagine synthetase [glutamine-hydrolyzing] 2 [compost metagenome]